MKSTGLFGKNSGRVGGVVYSNYRGQQIVRSYQPQVKNPNSKGQVAQRAKFKLVSQLGAVFGKELKNSFYPNDSKLTSRNAWVKKMLNKTIYSNSEASLPIEEIVLTNATGGILTADATNQLEVYLPASIWDRDRVKARALIIGYSNGGDIVPIATQTLSVTAGDSGDQIELTAPVPGITPGYGNVRAIIYAYEQNSGTSITYEDYEVQDQEATLSDIVNAVGLSNLRFSESLNIPIPQSV